MNPDNTPRSLSTPRAPGLDATLAAMSSFLEGQKADDLFVHVFNQPNPICDAVIIATANSRRHAKGLADGLLSLCQELPHEYLRMEGYEEAQWILVDCNDIIVHIFQPDARQAYGLEDLCVDGEQKILNLSRENRS